MEKLLCNGLDTIVSQALDEMKETQGQDFQLETVNLAELQRRTGISRARLRAWKKNGFAFKSHGLCGHSPNHLLLSGYMPILNTLLTNGISNSSICFHRLQQEGYTGSLTTIKRYITSHKSLIPAKQQMVMPQRNRGRRFVTEPGEAYQMDWGFTNVATNYGQTLRAACFAMICHHCGQRYIEFFPNAKQENLFIGMIHAFRYMGVPAYILTDNMKSVVLHRSMDGQPVWQKDYESFMRTVGFETKLCKPRHPFTKGAVERLVRFVKENFLAGRVFYNVTDLNWQALNWCNTQNGIHHKAIDGVPQQFHTKLCSEQLQALANTDEVRFYLCPERKISFDGFVNYEGRRFGVPYSYLGATARISRRGDTLYIYSADLKVLLTTHDVTWSRRDSFCEGQYETLQQPEEFPTMPVKTQICQLPKPSDNLSFDKFDFDKEDLV